MNMHDRMALPQIAVKRRPLRRDKVWRMWARMNFAIWMENVLTFKNGKEYSVVNAGRKLLHRDEKCPGGLAKVRA